MIIKSEEDIMHEIPKYTNLHEQLLPVLQESLQSERLEIRKVEKESEKFKMVLERFPVLKDAVYVIFSKYIKKCEHQYETFIFLDEHGKSITHIGGRDLTLYGIIKPCEEFAISQDFVYYGEH